MDGIGNPKEPEGTLLYSYRAQGIVNYDATVHQDLHAVQYCKYALISDHSADGNQAQQCEPVPS